MRAAKTKIYGPTGDVVSTAQAVAKVEPKKPPLSDEGASEVAVLLRAVADPNVDVEKAKAIEEMIERRRAAHAKKLFIQAFIDLQDALPEINRDGKIVAEGTSRAGKAYKQNTPYATFPNLYKTIKPILKRHGFALLCEPDAGKDGVGVIIRGQLVHTAGHQIEGVLPLQLETSGSKNNLQGVGSSISYGRRYMAITLCQIISKAPEDEDLDGNAPPKKAKGKQAEPEAEPEDDGKINMEQAQALQAKINDCGVPLEKFRSKYGEPAELPVAMLKEAMAACDDYKAKVA